MSRVVLTGATGFLGVVALDRLLDDGHEVIAFARAEDDAAAQARINGSLAQIGRPVRAVRALAAELTGALPAFDSPPDVIVHCAADVRFDRTIDEARAINVAGTRNMLSLAGPDTRFVHVSTAFVGGDLEGVWTEDCDQPAAARNSYEQSKIEAEGFVRSSGLDYAIVRPSIVVGERGSGWTASWNVIYPLLRAFDRGWLEQLPADPNGIVDIVPVDLVGIAMATLARPGAPQGTYHVCGGPDAPTVQELSDLIASRANRTTPIFEPDAPLPAGFETFAPYLRVRTRFDDTAGRALLDAEGAYHPPLVALVEAVLGYARAAGWGKRPMTLAEARGGSALAA